MVPRDCQGWCVTCAGHGDLGSHTPSHRAWQRKLFPLLRYSALSRSFLMKKRARQRVPEKGLPYLLRLLTAMHTARISASATRAATMISHSAGRVEGGEESALTYHLLYFCRYTWMVFCFAKPFCATRLLFIIQPETGQPR